MSYPVEHYQKFYGPLKVSTIFTVIGRLWYGPLHPDQLRASGETYKQLEKLWIGFRRPGEPLMIGGCEITYDAEVEDGVILFVDSSNPKTGKCNGHLKIQEVFATQSGAAPMTEAGR